MTTPPCESFEIAIERELHGASSKEEHAELAIHLATCDRCRAYAEAAKRSQTGLVGIAATPAEFDWSKLEAHIRRELKRQYRRLLLRMAIGAAAAALAIWGLASDGDHAGLARDTLPIVGAVLIARLAYDLVETRSVKRAHADGLFETYRRTLVRRIRSVKTFRWVAIAVVVAILGLAFGLPELTVRARSVYGALAAIVGAVCGDSALIELPRLERELAELNRDATTEAES